MPGEKAEEAVKCGRPASIRATATAASTSAGHRPERQLHPELPRAADASPAYRQLRRARRQPRFLEEPVRRQPGPLEHAEGRRAAMLRRCGPGRDYSLEEVAKHAGLRAVPHRRGFPLAERYGNKVPTHEEAIVIAKRMGGPCFPSQAWPNPTTIFMRQAGEVAPIASRSTATGLAGPTRTRIWDAAWTLVAGHGERNKEVGYQGDPCTCTARVPVRRLHEYGQHCPRLGRHHAARLLHDINLWFCPNNGNASVIFPASIGWSSIPPRLPGFRRVLRLLPVSSLGGVHLDPDWNVGMYKAMGVPWNTKDRTPLRPRTSTMRQCQTFIDKWTEQLGDDYDASGAPSSYGPTTTAC